MKRENEKESTPKTIGEKNTSSSTTGGGSISAPTGTAPAAGSSAISIRPTGAGGAGSSAIEEKGWCRLTVTQNTKNFLHRSAGKMTVIEAKPGNLYAKPAKHHARPRAEKYGGI